VTTVHSPNMLILLLIALRFKFISNW